MSATAIAALLGGRPILKRNIQSDFDLAELVRAGIPATALAHVAQRLVDAVGSQAAIYEVIGSTRTLQRKRAAGQRLSRDESDRLARLARIVARAEEALASEARAHRWLARPNRGLEGRSPLSLVDSDAGTLAVERVLGRIEHGLYS